MRLSEHEPASGRYVIESGELQLNSRIHSAVLAALLALLALACAAAPALAAAPETPVKEEFKEVTATTATLRGELNSGKAGELGEYYFEYRVSGSECEGESAAPGEPAERVALGFKEEEVKVKLEGLQPNAKYTFCLVERSAAPPNEEAKGVPVTFETKAAPPAIQENSESVSSINAGGARLEAVVNPDNETTECKFQYGAEPLMAKETTTTLCEPASFPAEYGGQGVALNVGGLVANTT
jgi:hypothetical protein